MICEAYICSYSENKHNQKQMFETIKNIKIILFKITFLPKNSEY